ncbi:MAG: hypothetical protein AABY96_01125 [Nitrospirota bacterium]
MSKFTSREIQLHVRNETKKKTPLDETKLRESRELDRAHMEWLLCATWDEVKERISEIGLQPGTPGYAQMRVLWNDFHRELQKKRKKF